MQNRPDGTHSHGDPAWFVNGSPPGVTIERTPSGLPVECKPTRLAQGGIQVGGSATLCRSPAIVPYSGVPRGRILRQAELFWSASDGVGDMFTRNAVADYKVCPDFSGWKFSGSFVYPVDGVATPFDWTLSISFQQSYFESVLLTTVHKPDGDHVNRGYSLAPPAAYGDSAYTGVGEFYPLGTSPYLGRIAWTLILQVPPYVPGSYTSVGGAQVGGSAVRT
jgi:hypothetical protein